LDTVSVNLTLKGGDWSFIGGAMIPADSTENYYFRRIRDTIRTANPATFNTAVRFNGLPGKMVYNFYTYLKQLPTALTDQIGGNVFTQIKAVSNTTLQNFLTSYDNNANPQYIFIRTRGKNLFTDN